VSDIAEYQGDCAGGACRALSAGGAAVIKAGLADPRAFLVLNPSNYTEIPLCQPFRDFSAE
jgi:hypothetical protein